MCIILYRRIRIITKNNLLKRYVSKYIYALQRYDIISLRMNITYPHNIHCNCRAVDILFVILLSACFGEVADVATWRYCINVKSKSFNQKLDIITCNIQLEIMEWVNGLLFIHNPFYPLDTFPYLTKPRSQTHYINTICLKQNYQFIRIFMDVSLL